LNILSHILRLRLPGVSATILTQYLDQVLEILYNASNSLIKVGALQFLEIALYVFPKGLTPKLEEIRDVAR
jgi:hypothetical protein